MNCSRLSKENIQKLTNKYTSHESSDYSEKSSEVRFKYIGDIIRARLARHRYTLLDFGCGPGNLYKYLLDNQLSNRVHYLGYDCREKTIEFCQDRFLSTDGYFVTNLPDGITFDIVVALGVISYEMSVDYLRQTIDYIKSLVLDTLIITLRKSSFHDNDDFFSFNKEEVYKLFEDMHVEIDSESLLHEYIVTCRKF
jgi:2-polyprenyl-3-methyl-5-hydroxy-6-metoxy-1,4-benzoquinol methylase